MTIPNLPPFFNMLYTTAKGALTPGANMYNDNTFQTLNQLIALINNWTNNGFPAPNKTTAEITALEPNAALGTIWFNTNLAKLQVKTAPGTVQTITST